MKKIIALLIMAAFLKSDVAMASETNSTAHILIDADTGIIISGSNIHEHRYPASLTKLMTALLLLEHTDMSENIMMSHDALFSIPRSSSHIAMNVGESITALEALYAIMLASANDVSNAIAEHIIGYGGDFFHAEASFASLMTIRARQLGAYNTTFKNAHGLHNPYQVTTAYDISLIMRELITHPIFLEVINTRFTTVGPTRFQHLERPLNNTNRMIQPGDFFHGYVVGGKTGFTNEAAHTFAAYSRNGAGLISVVLETQRFGIFTETARLLDYGFSQYGNIELLNTDFRAVIDINDEQVKVRPMANLIMNLPLGIDPGNVTKQIVVNGNSATMSVNYGLLNIGHVPLLIEEILFEPVQNGEPIRRVIPAEVESETGTFIAEVTSYEYSYYDESNLFRQISFAFLYALIATFAIFRVNRMIKSRRRKLRKARAPRGSAQRTSHRAAKQSESYKNYRNYKYK